MKEKVTGVKILKHILKKKHQRFSAEGHNSRRYVIMFYSP
jgi:hypothetical protein